MSGDHLDLDPRLEAVIEELAEDMAPDALGAMLVRAGLMQFAGNLCAEHAAQELKAVRGLCTRKIAELRLEGTELMLELQGYAHAYFDHAWDRDLVFSERAFDWAIQNMRSMRLLFEHEDIVKLAGRRDGTLAVWCDDIGLAFEAASPEPRVCQSQSTAMPSRLQLSWSHRQCPPEASRRDGARAIPWTIF